MTNTCQAPQAGALFDLNGSEFRVTGWLAEVPTATAKAEAWMDDILDGLGGNLVMGPRYRWCSQEEATHVAGSGAAGCIVPVASVTVKGMAKWSAEQIEEASNIAQQLAEQGDLIV